MAVNASPEAIRKMKEDIRGTIDEIVGIKDAIETHLRSQSDWRDEQSVRYRDLMARIAKLSASPSESLVEVLPQLDKLAEALEKYNQVRFE